MEPSKKWALNQSDKGVIWNSTKTECQDRSGYKYRAKKEKINCSTH